MVISYGNDSDRGLIDDVTPRHKTAIFDVRQPRVQHTAIGTLHAEYLRVQSFAPHSQPEPLDDELLDVPLAASERQATAYTRVPPLASLSAAGLAASMPQAGQTLKQGIQSTFSAVADAGRFILHLPLWAVQWIRPHTLYQYNKGVRRVWMVHRVSRQVLLLLVALVGLLSLLVLTQRPLASHAPQTTPSPPQQPTSQPVIVAPSSTATQPSATPALGTVTATPSAASLSSNPPATSATTPPVQTTSSNTTSSSDASSLPLVGPTQQAVNALLAPVLPVF
jgi:hypothetical protein